MKQFGNQDVQSTKMGYQNAFNKYGDSPKAMQWWGNRISIRYSRLIRFMNFSKCRILDIGCGLGRFNEYIQMGYGKETQYSYLGVDFLPEFIETAQKKYGRPGVEFLCGDLDQPDVYKEIQKWHPTWGIASGIFNTPGHPGEYECYDFMLSTMERCYDLCSEGISFNFKTDRVDYKKEGVAYHSPLKILDWAYSLTRNVIFDNSYMPFEASITLFKNDSFGEEICFRSFMDEHSEEFKKGIFVVEKRINEGTK